MALRFLELCRRCSAVTQRPANRTIRPRYPLTYWFNRGLSILLSRSPLFLRVTSLSPITYSHGPKPHFSVTKIQNLFFPSFQRFKGPLLRPWFGIRGGVCYFQIGSSDCVYTTQFEKSTCWPASAPPSSRFAGFPVVSSGESTVGPVLLKFQTRPNQSALSKKPIPGRRAWKIKENRPASPAAESGSASFPDFARRKTQLPRYTTRVSWLLAPASFPY
jgi:hypothetical protein